MIKTYPLESMSLDEAKQRQFLLIDLIAQEFRGNELLTRGDLGVRLGLNKPKFTLKAEKVIARYFDAEDALLVRGAGTGAIAKSLSVLKETEKKILVHDAPIYSTTKTTLEMLSLEPVFIDFNDLSKLEEFLKNNKEIKLALVQITRQKVRDNYEAKEVIELLNKYKLRTITDDNYAVNKVRKIGSQLGADLSAFSSFKLLGPEGIGIIVGKKKYIKQIKDTQYSGGIQVQGYEAMDVLQGLTYSPVLLAIQAEVIDEVIYKLNQNEIKEIKQAFVANAQSKVIIVEFNEEIAEQVLVEAEKLGALPNPVGSESKYENTPLFYRVSGTFIKENPVYKKTMIRINPFRSGSDTILRILKEAIKNIK